MTQSHNPYSPLRAWRRGAAFRQKEVARILGLRGIAQLSRVERGERMPGLSLAIAIQVLTGMPLEEILKPYYDAVEEETLARATRLLGQIEESVCRVARIKAHHLRGCQERVISRHKKNNNHA